MAKTQLTRTGKAQQLFKNGVRPIEVCKGLWTINEDRYELPLQCNSRPLETSPENAPPQLQYQQIFNIFFVR
jgi:hypothetical protein